MPATFSTLPLELVEDIASNLPVADLFSLSLTSRHLHAWLSSSVDARFPAAAPHILIWAILAKRPDILERALLIAPFPQEQLTPSVFLKAFHDGNDDVLCVLLRHGVDFRQGNLITHLVSRGNYDMVKMLMANGVNLNVQWPGTINPLRIALEHEELHIARLLLQAGGRMMYPFILWEDEYTDGLIALLREFKVSYKVLNSTKRIYDY